ncbi:MAG: hypothetical protein CVV24_11520 [Ignavibacteriae bacterium HGW-Ignavibacteriae-3]|nr:MAG: hypothetical protein CVV24_11520 [Ignavibacteriae bacterium HGW-Ignavibacteriae-3]
MRNNFILKLMLIVFGFIYLEGCAPSIPVKMERTIAPDRLIKRIEANRRKIKNLTASGTISVKTSELDTKSSFQVEIKKPDSIRVEFYGPFGIDLAHALLTQNNFTFYDIINNTVYSGKQRPGVMKEILKVDISYDDLMDLVSGAVNLTDKLRSEPDSFETRDELMKLMYIDSVNNITNSYFIQFDKLEVRQALRTNSKGKNLIDTKFSNFRMIDEIPVPSEIVYDDQANSQKIKVEYKKIEINNEIGKLKLDIPSDAKIIVW